MVSDSVAFRRATIASGTRGTSIIGGVVFAPLIVRGASGLSKAIAPTASTISPAFSQYRMEF
jgi:hypothetical protein